MSWARYHGKAMADAALSGEALFAELEGAIRMQHPSLTDIRLEQATEAGGDAAPQRRHYEVVYLADDGEGQGP